MRKRSREACCDRPAGETVLHARAGKHAVARARARLGEIAGPGDSWRAAAMTACLAAGVLAGCFGALAQTFQGGVRGIVLDPNAALIPNAELTLVNDETGVVRSTVSNAAGEYSFANVQPGVYTLSADLEGFTSFVAEGLTVGISTFLVSDITLNVGGVEETITVTAETPLIENGTASVASTIDRKQIEVLPSPGRNVFILAVTTPNVVHTGNPVWVKQSDQTNSSLLSLGGGPLRGNNYTIDGVSMTDLRNRSVIIPVFEAVQEMKVQTNTYDAEMGRTGGGVFNTIHRRGTNDWAGSALYQFRPGELNTFWRKLAYYQQQDFDSGLLRPQDLENAPYNLFGGSFGGPISAGRTFFWLAAEGYSDHAISNTTVTVPTPAEASGDFSQSRNAIYDPFSLTADGRRPAFANSQIPSSSTDPAGSALADLLATLGPGGQISTSGVQVVRAIQTTGNLSHAFNDRWHLSGTYLHYQSTEPLFGHYQDLLNSDTRPVFGIGSSTLGRDVHAVAINTTILPTANSVFTVRYGQTYFNDSLSSPAFGKDQFGAQLGIRGDFLDKLYAQEGYEGQFPKIYVADFGNNGNALGGNSNNDVQWLSREISGTYGQFVGNHTLKWGGQWRRLGLHTANFGNGMVLRFAKKFTQGPDPTHPATGSGSALADLLLGIPDGGSATLAAPADLFLDYFGGFFQDDWRIAPDLVLNLGLRVEHETGLKEDSNDFAVGWDRQSPFPLQVGLPSSLQGRLPGFPLKGGLMYAGLDGNPTHQWNPPAAKLGPRVGFAYSLNASTVIRGGFAVFWAPYAIPAGTGASETGTYGYTAVTNVEASIDGITPSESTASNPFPRGILDPVGNANGRLQNIGGDVYFNDQHRDSPYIKKWSLDLQRDIGRGIALKVGYVGSQGTNLPIGGTFNSVVNINQLADDSLSLGDRLNERHPNPFYGDVGFGSFAGEQTLPLGQLLRPFPHFRNVYARHVSAGKSMYHGLRFELERRFGRAWGARLNYTHTRHRDNIYEANTLLESLTRTVYNTPDGCAAGKCPVLESDYSLSRIHAPHLMNLNFMYQTRGTSKLLSGWSVSMATILRSGFPLVITQNENPLSAYGFSHQRPQNVEIAGGGDPARNPDQYVTARAVVPTDGLQLSQAPHTTDAVRSPALVNWDVALEKRVPIREDINLSLRFEFINLLNQVNWRGPRTIYGSDTFGSIPGTRGFPRTFQLLTKIVF